MNPTNPPNRGPPMPRARAGEALGSSLDYLVIINEEASP